MIVCVGVMVGSAVGGAFAVSAAAVSAIAVAMSSSEGVGEAEEHPISIIETGNIMQIKCFIHLLTFCCSIQLCIISYRNMELTFLPVLFLFSYAG